MNASASTEPTICVARAADRAEQTELAGALRDQDRERVEDDEPADEQADPGEAEQRRVEEAEQLLDRLRGLGHDLGRAQDLDVAERLRAATARPTAGRRRRRRTTLIASSPSSPNSRCAVRRSKAANVSGPRSVRSPNVKMPTSRKSRCGPSSRTPTSSPTEYPSRRAVASSIATSPSRAGARPSAMRNGPTPGVVAHEIPTVGAPALVTVSPSASTNCAKPCTNPSAPATPGSDRTCVDRGLGELRAGPDPARRRRTHLRGARRGRCPTPVWANATSNDRRSVSVST